jgi:hypothetical protein
MVRCFSMACLLTKEIYCCIEEIKFFDSILSQLAMVYLDTGVSK